MSRRFGIHSLIVIVCTLGRRLHVADASDVRIVSNTSITTNRRGLIFDLDDTNLKKNYCRLI